MCHYVFSWRSICDTPWGPTASDLHMHMAASRKTIVSSSTMPNQSSVVEICQDDAWIDPYRMNSKAPRNRTASLIKSESWQCLSCIQDCIQGLESPRQLCHALPCCACDILFGTIRSDAHGAASCSRCRCHVTCRSLARSSLGITGHSPSLLSLLSTLHLYHGLCNSETSSIHFPI